jgi:hypothetical protein
LDGGKAKDGGEELVEGEAVYASVRVSVREVTYSSIFMMDDTQPSTAVVLVP